MTSWIHSKIIWPLAENSIISNCASLILFCFFPNPIGEAKIEDLSQQAQIDAAKKFNAAEAPQPSEMGGTGTTGKLFCLIQYFELNIF